MPFAKGKSGNPGGRPRENNEIKELARAKSVDAFKRIVKMTKDTDPKIALPACKEVLDRAYGKPTQALTGEDGGPLKQILEIAWKRPIESQ